jgi:hypothetical protein
MRFVLIFTALVIALLGCADFQQLPEVQVIAQVPPTPPTTAEPTLTPDANEEFRRVPERFAKVDFRNFKYPLGRLKDGELDTRDPQNPMAGGMTFSLTDVFYLDLDGNEDEEAVVLMNEVGCGVSCDGGATVIYIYSANGRTPTLRGKIDLGSRSSGCSLKSLAIENAKLEIVQFGKCTTGPYSDPTVPRCKFCASGETTSSWILNGGKLKRTSVAEQDTPEVDTMNYVSTITIK